MDSSEIQDSIQVFIRIKPGSEEQSLVYTHNQIKLDKHSFAFDKVFPPSSEQEDIFLNVGKKLITHALEGYNSCVFVYGQTGSGKTHTMMGQNNGLMQRSFYELFSRIDRMSQSQFMISCSYYELYNEQFIDLLDNKKEKRNLNIRQDVKKGTFIENLIEESVMSAQKLTECLNNGMKNRHIGETMMNRESSRSHSIFTVSLAIKSQIEGKKILKTPKLHFVDLAGSQRQKMTMASGERLKQAGNINKSLTTLGMVINALASEKPKVHIPYRDSKLTCLLRDSLGGNSKTFIVATISTSILCFQETLSTLNFANRAKMVKVKALINEQSLSTNIEHYKEEIKRLRLQILRLKGQKKSSVSMGGIQHKFEQLTSRIEDLTNKMPCPSMDNIMALFANSTPQQIVANDHKMINEVDQRQFEQEGRQLMDYMTSNHELLKRIHSTVQEYSELRSELKNIQFNKRLPIQTIKTPSKFQREQYENLINKRQDYIKELQEKNNELKQLHIKKEIENKEIKRKLLNNVKTEDQESSSKIKQELSQILKKYDQSLINIEGLSQEKNKHQKSCIQLEMRLKQSKQLYIYTEQKYQNQKFMKQKMQSTLKQLNKKYHQLQNDRENENSQLKNRIQQLQQFAEQFDAREEELRNQIDVLNETIQFNKKIMKEYKQKAQQQTKLISQLTLANQKLEQNYNILIIEYQHYKSQQSQNMSSLKQQNNQLRAQNQINESKILKMNRQIVEKRDEIEKMKEQYHSNMISMEKLYQGQRQNNLRISLELDQTKLDSRREKHENELKYHSLQKNNEILIQKLSLFENELKMKIVMYEDLKSTSQKQIRQLVIKNQKYQQDLSQSIKSSQVLSVKTKQLQQKVNSTRNIVQEYEQLKKTYKDIVKQNYKLKGQYSHVTLGQINKNQQLISKVTFYEQKFKLMSMQYNQVQETTKKLKQKEINLLKKLSYYEQNQKLKKINDHNEDEEEQMQKMKQLQLQNNELKAQILKLSSINESLTHKDKNEDYSKRISIENQRYEMEQRERVFRKKLQGVVKYWSAAKQNNLERMNIDEMFDCWQKIEIQSRKKIEGINRGIKRQQKLRSQNQFIFKQNIYLRDKLEKLQKQLSLESGNPRKLIKPNEVLSNQ